MNTFWLDLTTVQVAREALTSDGFGGATVTTTLSTLDKAAIWQAGSSDRFLSDKIAKASTHVLVTTPTYSWTPEDAKVVYSSNTYKVVGLADDVMQLGEMVVVGLERIV